MLPPRRMLRSLFLFSLYSSVCHPQTKNFSFITNFPLLRNTKDEPLFRFSVKNEFSIILLVFLKFSSSLLVVVYIYIHTIGDSFSEKNDKAREKQRRDVYTAAAVYTYSRCIEMKCERIRGFSFSAKRGKAEVMEFTSANISFTKINFTCEIRV